MHSIIQELYYGNLSIFDRRPSEEYRQLFGCFVEASEEFEKTLTKPQKQMLEQLINQLDDAYCCEAREKFCVGFCLGARILLEVLQCPDLSP